MKLEVTDVEVTGRFSLSMRELTMLNHIMKYDVAHYIAEECSRVYTEEQLKPLCHDLRYLTEAVIEQRRTMLGAVNKVEKK